MRAHTAVGRFLEIYRDGLAHRIDADGHHETRRALPAMPHAASRQLLHIAIAQKTHKVTAAPARSAIGTAVGGHTARKQCRAGRTHSVGRTKVFHPCRGDHLQLFPCHEAKTFVLGAYPQRR